VVLSRISVRSSNSRDPTTKQKEFRISTAVASSTRNQELDLFSHLHETERIDAQASIESSDDAAAASNSASSREHGLVDDYDDDEDEDSMHMISITPSLHVQDL